MTNLEYLQEFVSETKTNLKNIRRCLINCNNLMGRPYIGSRLFLNIFHEEDKPFPKVNVTGLAAAKHGVHDGCIFCRLYRYEKFIKLLI